jgi:hypothetical protein
VAVSGGAAEKRGEAPDMPDIVLLRVRPEAAHRDVLQHPLTQRMGRGNSRDSIHGKFLSVERTPQSQGNAAQPIALQILRYVTPSDPPAQRVRALVVPGRQRRDMPCLLSRFRGYEAAIPDCP